MADLPNDVEVDCAEEMPVRQAIHDDSILHKLGQKVGIDNVSLRIDSGIGDSIKSCDDIDTCIDNSEHIDELNKNFNQISLDNHVKAPVQETTVEEDTRLQGPSTELVYQQDQDGDNQLHISIIQRLPQYALYIICSATHYNLLNLKNGIHQTALHLATITKQAPIIRRLVASGADVEIRDRNGNTPLHLACQYANLECVYQITAPVSWREVKQSSYEVPFQRIPQDLDTLNYEGLSCLHLAAMRCEYEIMSHLLRIGAEINIEDGKSGRTVLHYAIETHNTRMVQFLLARKADVNAQTFDRSSPMSLAMGRGYQDIVALLVLAGADYGSLDYKPDESDMSDISDDDLVNDDDFRIAGEPVVSS